MKVALVAIAKDEDHYIDEWVKYHTIVGFDDIYIYGDDWFFSNANEYSNVKFEYIRRKNPYASVKNPQVSMYCRFCKMHWQDYDWAAFFDIDEFLVLKTCKNIKDLLVQYAEFPGVLINWLYFGDNGLSAIDNNQYSVIDRFTKSSKNINVVGKSIINFNILQNKFEMGCHNIKQNSHGLCLVDINKQTITNSSGNNFGNGTITANNSMLEMAYLAHYRTKTMSEFQDKVKRNIDGYGDKDWTARIDQFNQFNRNDIDNFDVQRIYYGKNN